MKPRKNGQAGAVMLEYILVLLVLSFRLLAWSSTIYSTETGFGSLGREIVNMYQRVVSGISLPVP